MTVDEVRKFLGIVKANWQERFIVDDLTISLWHRFLSAVEAPTAFKALHQYIGTGAHPPKIAEILKLISKPLDGDDTIAAEQWGEVVRAISKYGRDREPRFAHPITARLVAGFTWRALCDSENQVADRARFIDGWQTASVDHEKREALAVAPPAAPDRHALEAPVFPALGSRK